MALEEWPIHSRTYLLRQILLSTAACKEMPEGMQLAVLGILKTALP
jgi:hypothetical protein